MTAPAPSTTPVHPAPPGALLSVRGLNVTIGHGEDTVRLVRDVDLDVERGELVALLGESGSGKSVTARALLGLGTEGMRTTAQTMRFDGIDLLTLSERDFRPLRGPRMSLVFQDALSALNPVLSIGDQIGELVRVHTPASRRAARTRAVELLALVGIPAPSRRVHDYPHQFSGGMRQRILIAMAVALQPDLLVADEPTTALDVTVQAQILDLLQRLRSELGMGVLLITHDLGVVSEVADRVAVMYAGRIVESGHGDDVLSHPAHPYTESLLRSVPRGAVHGATLEPIPGSPPLPAQTPHGCSFHPRCGWKIDACSTTRPEPVTLNGSMGARTSACLRIEEVTGAHR